MLLLTPAGDISSPRERAQMGTGTATDTRQVLHCIISPPRFRSGFRPVCTRLVLSRRVRPRSSSPASPEDFKLGRAAMAGPEKKPERDSRGHGYSWRDLVQRICNLHFKHTLKSVPGRQPRSALTLVAGGPRWCSDIFSFKTEHTHAHKNTLSHTTTHRTRDLAVFIALL